MIGRHAPTIGFVAGLALVKLFRDVPADLLAGDKFTLGEGLGGVAAGKAGIVGKVVGQQPRRGQRCGGLVFPRAAQNAHLKIPGFGAGVEALLGCCIQQGQALRPIAPLPRSRTGPGPARTGVEEARNPTRQVRARSLL